MEAEPTGNTPRIHAIKNQRPDCQTVKQATVHLPAESNHQNMNYKQNYDPKYGGKSVFEFPSLKRMKQRVSVSGTVIVCLVCFALYSQFGNNKTSLTSNAQNDEIIHLNPGFITHEAPIFKPAPVHLRPGYVAPPDHNQPDPAHHNRLDKQQPDWPNRLDHKEFQESLQKAYERSKNNLEELTGQKSREHQILNENSYFNYENEQDNGRVTLAAELNDNGRDFDINFLLNEKSRDEQNNERNGADFREELNRIAHPAPQERQNNGAADDSQLNRIAPQADDNQHDFHALKQKYGERKEPQMIDRDLSQYAAAGRSAMNKQLVNQNAANPLAEFMKKEREADEIKPQPKQWPVRVLKQPDIGCLANIQVLILVHTHPSAFGTRRAIRNSWGVQTIEKYPRLGDYLKWKTIFILGTSETKQWEVEVSTEDEEFKDILQADFVDNQYEGTRKFLLANNWLTKNLQQDCEPRFILKTEENIYHNMNSIIGWLEAKFPNGASGIYLGKKLTKDLPIREPRDPNYVSWQDYPKTYFPDMIQGPEFLFDYETYKSLAYQTKHVTKLAMEEGYISLLADRGGIKPTHNEHFVLLEETSNVCHMLRMFFVTDVKPSEHKKIFRNTKEALVNGRCPNAHVIEAGNRRVNIEM